MLKLLNRILVLLLLTAAGTGVALSMLVLFLPGFFDDGFQIDAIESVERSPTFVLVADSISVNPEYSPYARNYTVHTPPLDEFDLVYLEVYSEGRYLGQIDCLEDYIYNEESYAGLTRLNCPVYVPYQYSTLQNYEVYAIIYGDGFEYASGPAHISADWYDYENYFWGVSVFLLIGTAVAYILVLFPLVLAIAYIAAKMKHDDADYTIFSLLNPFANKKTLLQKFNAFIESPYFWGLELAGIFIILLYMLVTAQVWKSTEAFIAFFLSGLLAFIVPFLWCVAWWYADFREREPLRIITTFFLWGMLAALMAIGFNSAMGLVFELIGLGFLGSFLVAPVIEELYKGTGVALFGEHREFNSIEDGLVFGFVVGMGFSFIEDWIYLLQYPMGSDILSWFLLFLMRSIMFSANHGFYTAITGGVIGFFIEKGFKAPALGLLVGFPIAAIFHAVHNSGELLGVLFGAGGLFAYCCFLIPLFDYGGFLVLVALFLWALLRGRA